MFFSILSTAGFVLVASQLHAAFKPNQDRDAPHLSDLFTSKGKEIWRNGPTATATVAAAQLFMVSACRCLLPSSRHGGHSPLPREFP